MIEFTFEVALYQMNRGKYFIIENPESSAIWWTELAEQLRTKGAKFDSLHMCMYGLCDAESKLLHYKPTALVHNLDKDLMLPLLRQCNW